MYDEELILKHLIEREWAELETYPAPFEQKHWYAQ